MAYYLGRACRQIAQRFRSPSSNGDGVGVRGIRMDCSNEMSPRFAPYLAILSTKHTVISIVPNR